MSQYHLREFNFFLDS